MLDSHKKERQKRKEWTTQELAILKENWKLGGVKTCKDLLPNRSISQIQAYARRIGLRIEERNKRQKFNWTEFLDKQVINSYADPKANIGRTAKRLGITPGAFYARAIVLGCQRRYKSVKWNAEEDNIILEYAGEGLKRLHNRLKKMGSCRSMTAIQSRVYYLGEGKPEDIDNFTASRLAKLCGVSDRMVRKWIEKGYLKANRQGGKFVIDDPANVYWKIKLKDFKDFVRDYPDAIDLRKVDRFWFLEIAFGLPRFQTSGQVSSSGGEQ